MILKTKDDVWQVSIDNRISGLDVQVSFWDGENFHTPYKMFVIADSWFEAITDALTESGWDWVVAQEQVNDWGITPPDDEDED
jgi:hypothetical protein